MVWRKEVVLLLVLCLTCGSSVAVRGLPHDAFVAFVLSVAVQSVAASGTLVLVVALQADAARLRPLHGNGFLYGAHSMLDKLSSGLSIVALQQLAQTSSSQVPSPGEHADTGAALAYYLGASTIPAAAALVGAVIAAAAVHDASALPDAAWPASVSSAPLLGDSFGQGSEPPGVAPMAAQAGPASAELAPVHPARKAREL